MPILDKRIIKIFQHLLISVMVIAGYGCLSEDGSNGSSGGPTGNNGGSGNLGTWGVPAAEVKDGGPGKDGIPALENPSFLTTGDALYLSNDDLVLGYKRGNEIRAYPHRILDYHEIVNDVVDGFPISITYCPLTGSGIGWVSGVNGETTTFGVSGLLYNTNLIPYDRATDSNWSQMKLECVNGTLLGTKIETFHLVETTWATWKSMYPNTKVLSNFTGHSRNYNIYPYGDYKTNNEFLLFRVKPDDNRLPRKARVMGVIVNDEARVYEFSKLPNGIKVINDDYNGVDIVVVGSKAKNFMIAFDRKLEDGTILEFEAIQDGGATILKDNEGNQWDIFGEAISGSRKGKVLKNTSSFVGYWMAWGSFYPNAEIADFKSGE